MRWVLEGALIIKKYMTDGEYRRQHFCAEHDQIWCGDYSGDRMSADDRQAMSDLYWFEDNESWSCYV